MVNWKLDEDIQSFFDRNDHDWMMRFTEHRICEKRLLRLVLKYLKVGVLEEETIVCPAVAEQHKWR